MITYYSNLYKCTQKKLNYNWGEINYERADIINSFVKYFISKNNSCDYLEIGCDSDRTFNKINIPDENKIGVDPFHGGTLRMTSDVFFKKNKKMFDIIFIDGLHEYTQVQKDCVNSLKVLKDNGIVIFHDMLPITWEQECIPRFSKKWNGDVWKIAIELMNNNGFKFNIIACDHGVGVLKKNRVNTSYKYMNKSISKLSFKDFIDKYYKQFNIISPDEFQAEKF